jgi:hypothetical protein
LLKKFVGGVRSQESVFRRQEIGFWGDRVMRQLPHLPHLPTVLDFLNRIYYDRDSPAVVFLT